MLTVTTASLVPALPSVAEVGDTLTETVCVVWAAASGARPAKNGSESSAAARTGRSRRTAEPARAATPRYAEAGSKRSGVSGPERRPAEQEDSGGEARRRERSHDADADWATRRPGDPATRRPGDPATRRPGDHYTVGTLSGACQPPGRTNLTRPAVQAQRLQERRCRRAKRVHCRIHHGHVIASEPGARLAARNAQTCQASPIPVSRTVSRARRKRKKANAPQPRDPQLLRHRQSMLRRRRHRIGFTQGCGFHDTHIQRAESGSHV